MGLFLLVVSQTCNPILYWFISCITIKIYDWCKCISLIKRKACISADICEYKTDWNNRNYDKIKHTEVGMWFLVVLWTHLVFISAELILPGCNNTEVCYGLRPISTSGCCPVLPGSVCDVDQICDLEFGYKCLDGFCAGTYNLTVVWVGKTRLNLTWLPYLPDGSNRTYSILYGTEFPADNGLLNSHNVGNVSVYTLEGLTPGTWYYVQIAVWTNSGYENLTEIVLAQTEAMDYCIYNGRRILVGEELIVDCEESCHCLSSGRFRCVPICQKQSAMSVCTDRDSPDQCCIHVNHCYNESCTYLGEPVEHQYSWIIDCAENCTCNDGSVTCVPLCDDVITDVNCTNPVITKSRDGCCEYMQCYEEDTSCIYKNTSYKTDTWFKTDCETCTCSSLTREVTCVDLKKCGSIVLPEVSPVCPHAVLQDSHCCSQLNCEKQTGPNDILGSFDITKFGRTSAIVQFHFISSKDIQEAVRMSLFCTTDTSGSNYSSWSSNFTYSFKDVIDATNETLEFRDFGKPFVLYKISNDFLFVLANLKMNTYYFVKLKVEFDKAKRVVQEYITTTKAIKFQGAPHHRPLSALDKRVHISVVNISSYTVFISWTVPERFLQNITSFLIKYKSLSDKNWQYTKRLIFTERQTELSCLHSLRWYEVQLEAYPGPRRLATTFFNTTAIQELSDEMFSISFINITLRTTSVFVAWRLTTSRDKYKISNIEILWSSANSNDIVYKNCFPGSRSSNTIPDLKPGTMYVVWLGINLLSGETVYSERLHLVTMHVTESSHSDISHSMVLAVTVTCVSCFAMCAAIATVIYLLKCKRRASYQNHTSFENRIFQIYSSKDDREL